MFKKIPKIRSADELLDTAFKRAKKISIYDKDRFYRLKKTIIARVDSFATHITSTLEKYVKGFPSIDNLPRFYQELIDIKIDVNKLRKSLGAVDWARKTCQSIYMKQASSLKKIGSLDFLKQKQKEIYGRISSVIKQVDKELRMLEEAESIIKRFPEISDIPTVVIAGYPNVGKSALLKMLSSAKPKVAAYPFTTQNIHVGHREETTGYTKMRCQLIDTPGLLDRALDERNKIEKQAIAALAHLADLIVFIVDPTGHCGYTIEEQRRLLRRVKKMFPSVPVIVVENKSDIMKRKSPYLKISCTTGEKIPALMEKIIEELDQSSKQRP
ncbi:MAG TPA: GTP-binding protein [Thermoplasmata archaeon]|nr:GTP-binding protein [Thermoplasmata archaeon]